MFDTLEDQIEKAEDVHPNPGSIRGPICRPSGDNGCCFRSLVHGHPTRRMRQRAPVPVGRLGLETQGRRST